MGDFQKLRVDATREFKVVRQSIPTTGKVGDSDKVKAALAVIEELMASSGGRMGYQPVLTSSSPPPSDTASCPDTV